MSRLFCRISGLTLVLLLVLVQGCDGQMISLVRGMMPSSDKTVSYQFLSQVYGITFCYNGKGYSLVSTSSSLDSIEDLDTRVHEAKHREQYTRYPSCEAFDAYYHTPKGRLESEAEAYHAGNCASIKAGKDPQELEATSIRRMWLWMGGGTPIYELVEAYRRYPCKDAS